MNIIASQLNKSSFMAHNIIPQQNGQNLEPKPHIVSKNTDKKDLYAKNKIALTSVGAIVLGGLAYIAVTRAKSRISNVPKTYIERFNVFGKKIIENLKLSPEGKILEKEILSDNIRHLAKYTDGTLSSVDEYIPISTKSLNDEKYLPIKAIMDETDSKFVILQSIGNSKNYYLLSSRGEKVVEVNEFGADPNASYQYLGMKLSPDKSKVYEIIDTYNPKDNAAFAEIFENFKF